MRGQHQVMWLPSDPSLNRREELRVQKTWVRETEAPGMGARLQGALLTGRNALTRDLSVHRVPRPEGYPTRRDGYRGRLAPRKRGSDTPHRHAGKTPQSEDVPPPREGSHPLGRGRPLSEWLLQPPGQEDENQEAIQ